MSDSRRWSGRDAEVRAVTSELNARMDELRAAVDALHAILTEPGPPPSEDGEKIAEPA